jgi:2,3-bisphosphoglycerate-independent phosphoglycerate mutase
LIRSAHEQNGTVHIAGILSNGGVHGHIEHLKAILEMCATALAPRVVVHGFLDGRDVGYNTARGFINEIEDKLARLKFTGSIATISGRYYAMDRDSHWERIAPVYEAMVHAHGENKFKTALYAIDYFYEKGVYDEEIPPCIIGELRPIGPSDALIFFNYRNDRMREIARAFSVPEFSGFDRGEFLKELKIVSFTEYDASLPIIVAFSPQQAGSPLAKILSDNGARQLHIAETEKYAHITYFLNGGRENVFTNEDRILIPSPRVSSYSEKPEMSAPEIASRLLAAIKSKKYEFIVVNFANADMVGHTGNLKAAILAIETVDGLFKEIIEAVVEQDGVALMTADHGNAEMMFDPQTGEINKEHTANAVPIIIVGKDFMREKSAPPDLSSFIPSGVLADIAPTILSIAGLPIPREMTGHSLI